MPHPVWILLVLKKVDENPSEPLWIDFFKLFYDGKLLFVTKYGILNVCKSEYLMKRIKIDIIRCY